LDFLLFNGENEFTDIPDNDLDDDNDIGEEEILTELADSKTDRDEWRQYVIDQGLTHKQIRGLLATIRKVHKRKDIPLAPSTLLRLTKKDIKTRTVAPGDYLHIGIVNTLTLADYPFLRREKKIKIDICIDGVPLVKSSKLSMWPILGAFVNRRDLNPFLIGVYVGRGSPESISEYLKDFVEEIEQITGNGGLIFGKKTIPFEIRAFCCDAPARAFLASTRYHTSYHGCTKCVQVGYRYKGRTVFRSYSVGARSDSTYNEREDPLFHSLSFQLREDLHPLEGLGMGMISQVPLEPMHLIDLGVMKKVLGIIVSNLGKKYFETKQLLKQTEEHLVLLRNFVPSEFQRKPRNFTELARYKATELRQFLLYTGPVVLKDTLKPEAYQAFLDLHIAVRLLYLSKELEHADLLLARFVDSFGTIFPLENLSYNVHSLLHFKADVEAFGLESMSNYKFENYLQILKNSLGSSTNIFAQILNTLELGKLKKTCLSYEELILTTDIQDNHCMLKDGSIVQISERNGDNAKGTRYLPSGISDFYLDQDPKCRALNGFTIDPKQISSTPVEFSIKESVSCKFYRMPYQDKFVVLPVIHTA
jgi:hypothetical protein